MSDDVLAKLNGLRDDVRARIEATTDYKSLMAVEKAIGEISALFPAAAAAAAPEKTAVEETTAKPVPEETAAAETEAAEAVTDAASAEEAAVEETVSDAADATDAVTSEAAEASDAEEALLEDVAAEEDAEATADAGPPEAAVEATPEATASAAPEATAEVVKIPEIPAEDRPLVAELAAAAAELPASGISSTSP